MGHFYKLEQRTNGFNTLRKTEIASMFQKNTLSYGLTGLPERRLSREQADVSLAT